MRPNRPSLRLGVLVLSALGLAPGDLAAQPLPHGPEARVDTLTGRMPGCPQVAPSRQGAAEIAWDYAGLAPFRAYVRHISLDGTPTDAAQYPVGPAGTAAAPVEVEVEAISLISYGFRLLTRIEDGNPAKPPKFFRNKLSPNGIPYSDAPRPVGGPTARWVWPGPGDVLFAGTYQADKKRLVIQQVGGTGKPTGPEIVVNTRPIVDPHPALVPIGNFNEYVVVWSGLSVASAGSSARQVIRARRIFKNQPEGKADFDVNSIPGGVPGQPPLLGESFVVATAAFSEGFTVAWTVANAAAAPSIHLRSFDFLGAPRGPESIAVPAAAGVAPVSLAVDDSGRLFLLWRQGQPPGSRLKARIFSSDAASAPLGPAFDISSVASADFGDQLCGDVAWSKDHWVVAWLAEKAGPGGIFTRLFTKWP
jgi:hypothetical protein